MTAQTTIRITILLALLASAMFIAVRGISSASAQGPGINQFESYPVVTLPGHSPEPDVVFDCWDLAKDTFVPCEDLDFEDGPPIGCPEGYSPALLGEDNWVCLPDVVEVTCEGVAALIQQGGPIGQATIAWYQENCVPPGRADCRELRSAIEAGLRLTAEAQAYYLEHCIDDEYTCEDLQRILDDRGRLTREQMAFYREHCREDHPRYTCEDLQRILDDKGRLTREQMAFYREYCREDHPRYTCEDLQRIVDDKGRLTREQRDYYERYCEERPRWDCRDLQHIIDDEGRLSREQQDFYDRHCERIEYTCDEAYELGLLTDEEYEELCGTTIPVCVDCDDTPEHDDTPGRDDTPRDDDTPERDECEDRNDCKVIIPPSTGTGAFFDTFTSTGGLGFASILLIVMGGALAGGLLRRKS